LIIQGYYITAATTPEDLKLYLPQYNWKKNVSDWYEGIYKGVFIYVDYDETAKKINWIDFGVDDENSWSED
jgi:transcriptional regulator of aromatic amino acid metabolism